MARVRPADFVERIVQIADRRDTALAPYTAVVQGASGGLYAVHPTIDPDAYDATDPAYLPALAGHYDTGTRVLILPVPGLGDVIVGRVGGEVGPTIVSGALPTLTGGVGLGSGVASFGLESNDHAGRLALTPAGAPTVGIVATFTFATPRLNANYAISLDSADADAAAASTRIYMPFSSRTTTGFTIDVATTVLPNVSHVYFYQIVEYRA